MLLMSELNFLPWLRHRLRVLRRLCSYEKTEDNNKGRIEGVINAGITR